MSKERMKNETVLKIRIIAKLLFYGLVAGLITGLFTSLVAGLIVSLVAGLFLGIVAGLIMGLITGIRSGDFVETIVTGLIMGLITGFGLTFWTQLLAILQGHDNYRALDFFISLVVTLVGWYIFKKTNQEQESETK